MDTSHLLCKLLFCHDKQNREHRAGGRSLISIYVSLTTTTEGSDSIVSFCSLMTFLCGSSKENFIVSDLSLFYSPASGCWNGYHWKNSEPKPWKQDQSKNILLCCFLPITQQLAYEGAEVNHKAPCGIRKQSLHTVCFPQGAYLV